MCPVKGVWVLVEQQDGKLQDGALELVGEGRRIADKMSEELSTVTLGNLLEEQVSLLAQYGAGQILSIEHPALKEHSLEINAQILASVVKERSPNVILAIDSINSTDLALRLAARLETGLVTSCDKIDVSSDKLLWLSKSVYGGKASATFVCPTTSPQMATISPDALELKTPATKRPAEVENVKVAIELEECRTKTVGFIKGAPETIDITEAEIVIDGGKGLCSREGFQLVEELAEVIGGSVGASRMAVDEGWAPVSRQIGQTGKTVKPKLLMACGVSGAIQHIMGMKDAKAIIAINIDRNAPIFKVADLAIVGDTLKILPSLTTQLRQMLVKNPRSTTER